MVETTGPARKSLILRIARKLFLALLALLLAVLVLPYLVAPLYRTGHPASALMAWRYLTGAPVSRQWVDLSAMAAPLPRSVVASEDAKFCTHRGVDWGALRDRYPLLSRRRPPRLAALHQAHLSWNDGRGGRAQAERVIMMR